MNEEIKQYLKDKLEIRLVATFHPGCYSGQVLEVHISLDGEEIASDYIPLCDLKND